MIDTKIDCTHDAHTLAFDFPVGEPPPDEEKVCSTPLCGSNPHEKREGYDAYCGVVFVFPESRWRVAICREGRQYLLQHFKRENVWENRSYFATKGGLKDGIVSKLGMNKYLEVKNKIDDLKI